MGNYENLHKVRSLMERLERLDEGLLYEGRIMVKDVYYDANDFMDMLENIGDKTIIRVGLLQACDLNIPKVKRRNPETNRMKGYPDYTMFNRDNADEVAGIVKLSSYGILYRKRAITGQQYGDYKAQYNALNSKWGLPIIQDKEKDFKEKSGFGDETTLYKGDNEAKKGNAYMTVNFAKQMGAPKIQYYLINQDGRIIREMEAAEVASYPPLRKDPSYLKKLRSMGHDDVMIDEYVRQLRELPKMSYKLLEFKNILYVAATIDGNKTAYINDKVAREVDGIQLNAADFLRLARERYKQERPEDDATNPAQG